MDSHSFTVEFSGVILSEQGKPTRIPVAMLGTFYKGKQKFTITRKDVAQMAENFKKRGNGNVVLDYEHASEFPEVAAGGPIPAAGWITGLDSAPDADGFVWADVQFTERASEMIAKGEYKYISPVINWGARDKSTGESQGATLRSAALTNTPVLDSMPAIRLSEAGWAIATEKGREEMGTKTAVMCSEHPEQQMLCPACPDDVDAFNGYMNALNASEASRRGGSVMVLSDAKRDDLGKILVDVSTLKSNDMISVELYRALESQSVALSEVAVAIAAGKIAPANKRAFTKIALADIASFRSVLDGMRPQVDLTEHGHGGGDPEATAGPEAAVNAEIIRLTDARAKSSGIPYSEAMRFVASDNPDLMARWLSLARRGATQQT